MESPSKKIDSLQMFGLGTRAKLKEKILMILKHKRKFDNDYSLEEFPRSAGKLGFFFAFCWEKM